MKKLVVLLFVPLLFIQCNESKKNATDAQMHSDSLQRLVNEKDAALYAVLGAFNDIETNLASIKDKEKIISATVKDVEDQRTREEKINEDINMIYELMQENKDKVAQLQKQLKKANVKNSELQNTIDGLLAKLEEKNAEIIELRKNLLEMNLVIDELTYTLDTLKVDNEAKASLIKSQDKSLNNGYYLMGTEKELKEKKVLNTKGGFIGIGAGKKLDASFNKELFTEIDIRNETKFTFDKAKKIKIVTTHPTSSYTIYGEKPVDSLVINNVQDFWSVSKYLLIIVD